jgi:hypothetical protein
MTVRRLGDHAPAAIKSTCKRGLGGTDDREGRRQSEVAHTIVNHGSPHTFVVLLNSNVPARPVPYYSAACRMIAEALAFFLG